MPVLDFKCWVGTKCGNQKAQHDNKEADGAKCGKNPRMKLLYSFFEKTMATKYTIMKESALPENMKVQSLTNDVVRQMKNISELVDQEKRNQVIDNYARKLMRSGYSKDKARNIIMAGLKGYEKVLGLEKRGKCKVHRSAKYSMKARYQKKLIGKSTWFMNRPTQSNSSPASKKVYKESAELTDGAKCGKQKSIGARRGKEQPDRAKFGKKKTDGAKCGKELADEAKCDKNEVSTVLFVPQTPHGELAQRLKLAEKELFKLCGTKVKIVERAGIGLKTVLVNPNPWAKQACGRIKCLPCQEEKNAGTCKKRSITYETRCKSCQAQGKDKIYIGESARSSYERGAEHSNDYLSEVADSHMFNHYIEDHNSEGSRPKFSMKVLKCHKTPLYRQVHEAILIAKNEPITLNTKNEYNRCLLPRLSVMIGEVESKEKPEEKRTEDNHLEDDIEVNPKRKTANWADHRTERKSKRRKVDKQAWRLPLGQVWQSNLNNVPYQTRVPRTPQGVKRRLLETEKTTKEDDSPKKIRILSLNQSKLKFCHKLAASQSNQQITEKMPESSAKNLISHFETLKPQAKNQNQKSNVKPSPSQSQCLREKVNITRKNSTTKNKTKHVSRATPTPITSYFSTQAKTEARAKKFPPEEEEKPPNSNETKPIKSPGLKLKGKAPKEGN